MGRPRDPSTLSTRLGLHPLNRYVRIGSGVLSIVPLIWLPISIDALVSHPSETHWSSSEHRAFPVFLGVHYVVVWLVFVLLALFEVDAYRRPAGRVGWLP